jgi:hypothetical protein
MAADAPGGTQGPSAQAAYRSALQEDKGAQARMTGRPEPDQVISRGPVTLRRYREDDLGAVFEAVTEQAFRLPGVDRVEIVHDELNVASGGVPRKLGFTEAGRRTIVPRSPEGTGVGVVWRLTRVR